MENRGHVYTRDEQRVADYIVERSGNNMGGGFDPIGFLIASHSYLGDQLKELTSAQSAFALIKQDAELLLDNAAAASQESRLLRNEEGEETALREAVRLNVYEPLMRIILALSVKQEDETKP